MSAPMPPAVLAPGQDEECARAPLGLWTAIALVVGTMIGSGVFVLPAMLAPFGAASLLGWGLSLAGSIAIALVFAWLASGISRSGGPYAYAHAAFGDRVGFIVAWSYWVCVWVGNAALAVAFAGSLGAVFPGLVATPARGALCAFAALAATTATNLVGLRETGWSQILLTLLKFVPLALFAIVGLFYVRVGDYVPVNPSGQSAWQIASVVGAMTMWAFLGLEAASVPSGSIRDAKRNVPRATIIGVLLAGFATMLACTVVIGLLPRDQLQASAAPMADAARHLWGGWAGTSVGIVAAISCFGALNGLVMLQGQTSLAGARDGIFPKVFARLDAQGTPAAGVLIGSALAALLMLTNYSKSLVGLFAFSALLSTAACLLPYAFCAAAWWKLHPDAPLLRRLVAIVAFVYSLWAISGTGKEPLFWGAALLVAGIPVYIWSRRA